MNMKTGSRIIAGVTIAAFLMVSAACQQANGTDTTKPSADQKAVNEVAGKITGDVVTTLRAAFTPALAENSVEIPAATAQVTIQQPAVEALSADLPEGMTVKVVFEGPKNATAKIELPDNQYTAAVTHGTADEDWTVSVEVKKGTAVKKVKIGAYIVKGSGAPAPTEQELVDAEAAKIKDAVLTGLQGGFKSNPGDISLVIADASTAVSLANTVTALVLPALPPTENDVVAEWVSSDDAAIKVADGAVTHGSSAQEVTISLKFTKGSATPKIVAVAKFTVEQQAAAPTEQELVDAEAAKIKDAVLTGLQGGFKSNPGDISLVIADASTAVSLANTVTALVLPALPPTENDVVAEWVSSDDAAIKVADGAVTHGSSAQEVTISLKFTKGSATPKIVAIAKFTVEQQAAAPTEQELVDAEAAKIKDAVLTGLQGGFKSNPGDISLVIANASTAVSLANTVTALVLPALPQTENDVVAEWVSSDDAAIKVADGAVTHGSSAQEVTISLKFTKGSATPKIVAIAKFTVEQQ